LPDPRGPILLNEIQMTDKTHLESGNSTERFESRVRVQGYRGSLYLRLIRRLEVHLDFASMHSTGSVAAEENISYPQPGPLWAVSP
jgi:hypothetical protein